MKEDDFGHHPVATTRLHGTSYAVGDRIVGSCRRRCTRTEAGNASEIRNGVILMLGAAAATGSVSSVGIGVIKQGDRIPAGSRIGMFKCSTCHRVSPALFPPDAGWAAEAFKERYDSK